MWITQKHQKKFEKRTQRTAKQKTQTKSTEQQHKSNFCNSITKLCFARIAKLFVAKYNASRLRLQRFFAIGKLFMRKFPLSVLTLSVATTAFAQENQNEVVTDLGELQVVVSKEAGKYVATKPASLKDDSPLFETARAITVLTPEQIEQKQASTVAELLENVAGVSSGVQGRRGWDDFIIRGQVSSAQMYVDGMRVQTSTNNLRAWDIGAAESVEVIKGPANAEYGMGLPGGIVNITSKRPEDENFAKVKYTAGSFNSHELSYDLNYAPNATTKGAFRLNGRVSNRDDATDYVYFKDRYIAPSYTFDLGDRADLTILGSYQWRDYIRQQGLPHNNTINFTTGVKTVRNAHEAYPSSTFFGLPDYGYTQKTARVGYDFGYKINDRVNFKSIFAVTRTETDGNPVLATSSGSFYSNGQIGRNINNQIKKDTMYTMDNRVSTYFATGSVDHDVTVGLDLLRERSDYYRRNDRARPNFDINNPSYTVNNITEGTASQSITTVQYAGLYIKDKIRYGDFTLSLQGRHDWAKTEIDNILNKSESSQRKDSKFTGGASLMYDYQGRFAPYIGYNTSFDQNSVPGSDGNVLAPETGEQYEIGVKFQGFDRRLQGYLAYYDLTRKNVAEVVDSSGDDNVYELVGKQRTKGFEVEAALVLNNQWNVSGSYSYIPTAKIEEASELYSYDVGERLSQVPKHAASVSTYYYLNPGRLGFYVGAGARYQGKRTAWRTNNTTRHFIDLPSYTLLDLKAGYNQESWGVDFAVKNVLNKEYLIGTTPNAQLVSFGEPRNARIALTLKF